jgi:predicted acylesterase/phospholipase RssA
LMNLMTVIVQKTMMETVTSKLITRKLSTICRSRLNWKKKEKQQKRQRKPKRKKKLRLLKEIKSRREMHLVKLSRIKLKLRHKILSSKNKRKRRSPLKLKLMPMLILKDWKRLRRKKRGLNSKIDRKLYRFQCLLRFQSLLTSGINQFRV